MDKGCYGICGKNIEASGGKMSESGGISDIQFRIRHTMLPVSNLDRTIDFYTRLLGMDIMRLREPAGQRVAYLGYGSEDEGPAFELIQNGDGGESAEVPTWAGHFALYVSDLSKLCAALKREGVAFTREPGPNRPGSSDLVAYILDPDGYTIELTERHSQTGPPIKK
jgi:lactoylglutathione lyase